jgi:hypothetical protein
VEQIYIPDGGNKNCKDSGETEVKYIYLSMFQLWRERRREMVLERTLCRPVNTLRSLDENLRILRRH